MDLRTLIADYYGSCKAMQLATVADERPWLCTVYFAYDERLNLYWTSGRSRQHSIEITNNSDCAVTIVKDIEHKQALQIIGTAREADDDEIETIHALYTDRYGPKDYDLEAMKRHDAEGRAYWVFKSDSISLWDEVNFPEAPKQQLIVGQ